MMGAKGFTLLEVLIALALFGLMLGMVFTTLTLAARTWEAAEPRAAALNGRLALERFLNRQLATALVWPDSQDSPSLVGEADRLSFIAFPPLVIGMRGPQRFQLLREGDDLKVQVLTLEGEMPAGEAESRDLILLGGVSEVRFRYFAAGEWQDAWEEEQLPQLVAMTLETQDGMNWPPLLIPIRGERVLEAGDTSDFGVLPLDQ